MNKLNFLMISFPIIINIIMLSLMMMQMKINKIHPIFLMMTLIFLTFLITFKMNFLKKSMISFMLFLIMIGGLMIIFMYITSLANNELFSFNIKIMLINTLKSIPMMMIFMIINFLFFQLILNYPFEMFQINDLFELNNKFFNLMYKESNNKSSYFIMIYLYFSMICIMNICYKLKNPLRQIFYYE